MFAWGQIYFQERWTLGVTRDMCRKRETKWQTKKNKIWMETSSYIDGGWWYTLNEEHEAEYKLFHTTWGSGEKPKMSPLIFEICLIWRFREYDLKHVFWEASVGIFYILWIFARLAELTSNIRFMKLFCTIFISQNRNFFKTSLSCDIKWTSCILENVLIYPLFLMLKSHTT